MVDALSRRYALISILSTKLLGFEHMKDLYEHDKDFATIYVACERAAFQDFFRHDGFLFKNGKLCVPKSFIRELLIREAHSGGLMRHFGIDKTLSILQEHFFWPNMHKCVVKICAQCISCRQAKSRVQLHGLYMPLPIPTHLWV